MRLYDIHAHLADERFSADFDGVLSRMHENRVEKCLVICDPGDLAPDHIRASQIVETHPQLLLSAACHPQNALHYTDATEEIVRSLAAKPYCRCIGETGLDEYDNQSTLAQQEHALQRQLDIAFETGLPVQLHVRSAHGRMIEILRDRKKSGRLPKCIVHCFTRNAELARAYLRLDCSISIAGPVTYTNANKLLETVRAIPQELLLIETDSPWVSPEPHRGEVGEPSFLRDTFLRVAELRGEDPERLSEVLWNNAKALFGE